MSSKPSPLDPASVLQKDLHWLRRRAGRQDKRYRQRLEASMATVASRRRRLPSPAWDPGLPITALREEIIEAIGTGQVVVIAGETGSGKSTQIPKLCLAAGRGVRGLIGCTQPRRIAARSVANRVAEELDSQPGEIVGYQVRFRERLSPDSFVKFMTDGILLAEIHRDRYLNRYDTLIIDEAHERSLNIDFLLGYLKNLLPRRPDLRVIITSATIDTEKFSRHFADAPVIQVSGRGYPVEMVYQPLDEGEDINRGIDRAVGKVSRQDPRGDILVFLPGEKDIFSAARYLRKRNLPHTEILPLYARLPAGAQDRIFRPGAGRRIVLATNVAETSLTVPGIRFVIDSGLARISRYATHSKVLRLPVEPVSRASADQRAGRCGRVAPGICVRLYSEDDYASRPEFTDPEILRTPLAATVLNLLSLKLGDPEDFPFVDPPRKKLFNEAWQTLFELGAVDEDRKLTGQGRQLARLPVDVRFGRMLIEAAARGALAEVQVLVAALSIPDPRERPPDQQQAADQAHGAFVDETSDFLSMLKLWRWWNKTLARNSRNQAEKQARKHFLAPGRLREWRDLHGQLGQMMREEKPGVNADPADAEAIHRSLLAGLLALVGRHEENGEYRGARGHVFRIFPGSVLARRRPGWIMAGELVETARPYARTVAPVKPAWLEQQASHLIRRRHFDPHWDARSGRVMGFEQVSLFGLVLAENRRIHYGPRDPETARELFIRHALVRGEMDLKAGFVRRNRELAEELAESENKRRRRDVLVDESRLEGFFDRILPDGIFTTKAFGRWYESLEAEARNRLLYDRATLLREDAREAEGDRFPDHLESGGERFRLEYIFDPEDPEDGVSLVCPLHLLNRLDSHQLEWLVPGLLEEKISALIGTLPKSIRRGLVPASDYARACREALDSGEDPAGESLVGFLARNLQRMSGMEIGPEDFDPGVLPAHLQMNIRVTESGRVRARGRDLDELRSRLGGQARKAFMERQETPFQASGLTGFPGIDLPETTRAGGHRAWPGLVAEGETAGVRLFDDPAEAMAAHQDGLAVLLRRSLAEKFRYLVRNSGLSSRDCLAWSVLGDCNTLAEQLRSAVLSGFLDEAWSVRDGKAFDRLAGNVRATIVERYQSLAGIVVEIVHQWRALSRKVDELADSHSEAARDMREQLDDLVYDGFVQDVRPDRLTEYPRYLRALEIRMERLAEDPGRDEARLAMIAPWWRCYLEHLSEEGWYSEELDGFRWLVEEFRVQIFAQELGTRGKVSEKRLERAWQQVRNLVSAG